MVLIREEEEGGCIPKPSDNRKALRHQKLVGPEPQKEAACPMADLWPTESARRIISLFYVVAAKLVTLDSHLRKLG